LLNLNVGYIYATYCLIVMLCVGGTAELGWTDDVKELKDYVLVFVRSPADVTVTEGEDASFECQLASLPAADVALSDPLPASPPPCLPVSLPVPVVRWYKDDDLIPPDDADFRQTFDRQTGVARLDIAGTYLDDAAVYSCAAAAGDTNRCHTELQAARVTATLTVNGILIRRRITALASCPSVRPSVRLPVCPVRDPNLITKNAEKNWSERSPLGVCHFFS